MAAGERTNAAKAPRKRGCCSCCCGWPCAAFLAAIAIARQAVSPPLVASPPDTKVSVGQPGWEANLRQHLSQHGYAHIAGLLNRSEAEALRAIGLNFCYGDERKALPLSWGGYSVPAFLELPEFAGARWLLEDARLHKLLGAAFDGAKYRFASHNDVGCDFVGVWHKDILRGPVAKYQVHDVWTPDEKGEQHEIYKVLFYLQDHDGDSRSVKVVPGSHVSRNISLDLGYTALHPRLGDAVMIDQRISHAGNSFYDVFGNGRLFMQVGFGRANQFTDEFERGTVVRQQGYQAKMLQQPSLKKGLKTVMADAKFFAVGLLFTALPPQALNFFADIDVKKYAWAGRLIFGSNAAGAKTSS